MQIESVYARSSTFVLSWKAAISLMILAVSIALHHQAHASSSLDCHCNRSRNETVALLFVQRACTEEKWSSDITSSRSSSHRNINLSASMILLYRSISSSLGNCVLEDISWLKCAWLRCLGFILPQCRCTVELVRFLPDRYIERQLAQKVKRRCAEQFKLTVD